MGSLFLKLFELFKLLKKEREKRKFYKKKKTQETLKTHVLPVRVGCVCGCGCHSNYIYNYKCQHSQLHMSVRHDPEHMRTERKTSRLQPTHTQGLGHPGLCDTPVGPGRTPTVRGKAVGGLTAPRRNDQQTTHDRQGLETNVLSVNKF